MTSIDPFAHGEYVAKRLPNLASMKPSAQLVALRSLLAEARGDADEAATIARQWTERRETALDTCRIVLAEISRLENGGVRNGIP